MAYESDRDRIARELRERITSGELPPGTLIPSAAQLAARYGVSTRTVQDATKMLREANVLHGRRGRGVYVGPDPENVRQAAEAPSLEERVAALEEWRRQVERGGR